jgi:hypothetical protein
MSSETRLLALAEWLQQSTDELMNMIIGTWVNGDSGHLSSSGKPFMALKE